LQHRVLDRVADVEYLPDRFGGLHQHRDGPHHIGYMHEAAPLLATAEDDEVFAHDSASHEVRDHHAVLRELARPDGVEEADCGDFEAMGFVKCVCNSFFKGLGI
jgi:hypothetical protein